MIKNTKEIRNRLKYSWIPFFSKFGKLTPVQIITIPEVLNRKNLIVVSKTATGKTEAIVAPLAEILITEKWKNLSVLYIVPTRALANDILTRIEGPLNDMNIKISIKHSDKPYLPSKNLPDFLITTPESLDSLICRSPNIFSNLKAIIIDEIHFLDNTYRGDQIRILLKRLHELTSQTHISIYLLSATLPDPHETAGRYMDKFEVMKIPGKREIDYYILETIQDVYELSRKKKWTKLLFFCNMRETVERISPEISKMWKPYPVVTHHGSLSRNERETAEKVMKESKNAVCISTSTLEIGIDIGDIDLIVLAEIPWSISSLLQRIGRGNRRENIAHVAAIVKTNDEKNLIETMFKLAISEILPAEEYKPDKSVAVQQIFSYLYQNPNGVPENILLSLLSPLCSEQEVKLILNHLYKLNFLEHKGKQWFASSKLMDLGQRGVIHSNIPNETSYRVIDINSGKEIGVISGVFDSVFILAGKIWEVVSFDNMTIKVHQFKGEANPALFKRHRQKGAFYFLLPNEIKDT